MPDAKNARELPPKLLAAVKGFTEYLENAEKRMSNKIEKNGGYKNENK